MEEYIDVVYQGQVLHLTRFWANNEPCLYITKPEQITMPKMEFVGGYPNEYCIWIKKLTDTEKSQITSLNGSAINLEKEIENLEKHDR